MGKNKILQALEKLANSSIDKLAFAVNMLTKGVAKGKKLGDYGFNKLLQPKQLPKFKFK